MCASFISSLIVSDYSDTYSNVDLSTYIYYIGRNVAKVQEILTLMRPNIPTHENGVENDGKMGQDISVFSYKSILAATRNFSDENKLGEGGFGFVYQVIYISRHFAFYIFKVPNYNRR